MMYLERAHLNIARPLVDFVENEALPGTGLPAKDFWNGLESLINRFGTRNRELLNKRRNPQSQIDEWLEMTPSASVATDLQIQFLRQIGYLVPEPEAFEIQTRNVDRELSDVAGPQLVVPVTNARYVLNAANARWGSLYDALYGTDAIPNIARIAKGGGYNPSRGSEVIARSREFLNVSIPLAKGRHEHARRYSVARGQLDIEMGDHVDRLADTTQFVAFRGSPDSPSTILCRNHGLYFEIHLDREHPVGRTDAAGISDIQLESAATTIIDFEDWVSTVDADDKTAAYRTWLALMRGSLSAEFDKGGQHLSRRLNQDRVYSTPAGGSLALPGRSLLLVRNVGLQLYTSAVLDSQGSETPEGILDALVTTMIGMHDLRNSGATRNSREGSIYIVKPKLHGPEEAAFAVEVLEGVETALGLPRHTVKVGLMDEERRTSANLAACIEAARHRLVFINTGFLDRTGDEIHTSRKAGAMIRKDEMRTSAW